MRLVISVIHQKGGVGKTTLSVSLAGELAKRGFETLLVDADPTESAQAWAKAGKLDFNVVGYPVLPGQTQAWAESISKLESQVFIIDCGPNDYSLAAACALTDVALLPCGASGLPRWHDARIAPDRSGARTAQRAAERACGADPCRRPDH